ncbi:hypothetical protein [Sphingobium sp. DN12]|uniref:hypothetical protein n=1 Tax=Sphingobium sp. DN12 TaxID=3378073 RepID=UPI003DA44D9A
MSFFIYHRYGVCERDPSPSIFSALLDELEERLDDEEHVSVSVIHEGEWGLGISRGYYVTFENVELDDEPRHMRGVSRDETLEMMQRLSVGDLAALESKPWQPGY